MLMMPASANCRLQAAPAACRLSARPSARQNLQVACRAFTPGKQSNKRTGAGVGTLSSYYRQLWSKIKPQHVDADLQTGICNAPQQHGQLGRPVKLLTNHLSLACNSAFSSCQIYHVDFSANSRRSVKSSSNDSSSSSSSSTSSSKQSVSISLDQRREVMTSFAQQQGWAEGSWQYEPSSNLLYMLCPVSTFEGTVATCGSSPGNQQQSTTWTLALIPDSSMGAAGGVQSASVLQLLGMLSKASLLAAAQQLQGVASARAALLPPGVLGISNNSSNGPAPSAGSGGGRGRQGAGRAGGGRGGAHRARGSSFPNVLQFWDSVSSNIKPTQQGMTLQLDASAGAVLPGKPLGELLTVPGAVNPAALTRDKKLLAEAAQLIKGAKVHVEYLPSGTRTMTVKGLDAKSAGSFSFKPKGGVAITVEAYFQQAYGIKLQHPDWPCVMVSKTAAIPMELCTVLPTPRKDLNDKQTAELIRVAALPPARRLQAYKTVMNRIVSGWTNFKQWGVTISANFMQVDGRVLPDAALEYGNSSGVLADNQGQWRPGSHTTLVKPAHLKTWAVINLASQRCSNRGVAAFVSHLSTEMAAQGMQAQQPATILDGSNYSGNVGGAFDAISSALIKRADSAQTQLVLVVLPAKGSALYRQVKEAAALRGLVTQCVVAPQARIQGDTANRDVPYLNNLLLKINVKLGGSNWQLPADPSVWAPLLGTQQLMVMGVDVSHGLTSSKKPSVAAVVGSQDTACICYCAAVLEQTAGHEVVLGMKEAAGHLLHGYCNQRGRLPEAILVFRDGVSDSMYAAVLQQEVADIRAACKSIAGPGCSPKVTYVVVSKNHGTRLFPASEADSLRGNVLPGTVVDTQLVAPLRYEFFINSHAGILGTNRPARLNVLVDDNNLGPDGIQVLTYHLSSIYCACNRTLSDPAPARYAHKAAHAGSFMRSSEPWKVVQPEQPGMKQLQYRMMSLAGAVPGSMWYV